jgi:hypothetical protein
MRGKAGARRAQQGSQRAEVGNELARDVDRAFAGNAGTQKNGQQLGIRQRAGAERQQFFARTFAFGSVADRHELWLERTGTGFWSRGHSGRIATLPRDNVAAIGGEQIHGC